MKSILDITKRERQEIVFRYGHDIAIVSKHDGTVFELVVGLNCEYFERKADALDYLMSLNLPDDWYYQ